MLKNQQKKLSQTVVSSMDDQQSESFDGGSLEFETVEDDEFYIAPLSEQMVLLDGYDDRIVDDGDESFSNTDFQSRKRKVAFFAIAGTLAVILLAGISSLEVLRAPENKNMPIPMLPEQTTADLSVPQVAEQHLANQ